MRSRNGVTRDLTSRLTTMHLDEITGKKIAPNIKRQLNEDFFKINQFNYEEIKEVS